MNIKISIKKLKTEAIIPERMTSQAAGYDLYASNLEPIKIPSGKISIIPTGIAISLPSGYEAQIRPRSGLAAKEGIGVLNSPGTIDADYRGEIKVILFNFGDKDFIVEQGMRIAQMVISSCVEVTFIQSNDLDKTERGDGGFGFTQLK